MGTDWHLAWGHWGCPDCPWTRRDDFEGCKVMWQMIGVSLSFIGVDWRVDWGVVDVMLSSIALEVARIIQHCPKGVMGCNMRSDNTGVICALEGGHSQNLQQIEF